MAGKSVTTGVKCGKTFSNHLKDLLIEGSEGKEVVNNHEKNDICEERSEIIVSGGLRGIANLSTTV